jgi:phage shock protein A
MGKRGPKHTVPDEPCPELRANKKSIRSVLAWANRHLASGALATTLAREVISAAKGMQSQMRLEHGLHELERYRVLVERMEAAQRAAKEAEVASRYGSADDIAEYDATVDGDGNGIN